MPLAKRRKASVGQEVENNSENETSSGTQDDSLDSSTTNLLVRESDCTAENGDEKVGDAENSSLPADNDKGASSEKDLGQRGCSKSLGETVLVMKLKEDAMKPVRISERLSIKRNKVDDEEECSSPAPTPTPKKQKSAPNVPKQQKKAPSSTTVIPGAPISTVSVATDGTAANVVEPNVTTQKVVKKTWDFWTTEETKTFFHYIGMYGKNFHLLCRWMAQAAKRKGLQPRKAIVIRYFYHRTLAKVTRILNYNVKSPSQEVYALINFGALVRYIKESNEQFADCLKELIKTGETTCIVMNGKKKKSQRIVTPFSRFFKKIEVEEKRVQDDLRLPSHVTIELTPKNTTAWARVQELSQNPRVRFKLSANRSLESVFKHLNSKWKSQRLRFKEGLGDSSEVSEDELCFHLPSSCELVPFTMKMTDVSVRNFAEKVFPNLLLEEKDEIKSASITAAMDQEDAEKSSQEWRKAADMGTGEESVDCLTTEKKESVISPESDKQTDCSEEFKHKKGNSSEPGAAIETSCPEQSVVMNNDFNQLDNDERMDISESCEEEDTSGESTSDQYLDFTPDGNLTVVKRFKPKPKPQIKPEPILTTESLTSSTSSSSLSSPPSILKSKPQLSPLASTNESSSLRLSPQQLPSSPSPSESTLPSSSSSAISSPLRSLTSALNLKPIFNVSPPSSSLSSLSNQTNTNSYLSPSLNNSNKKGAKKKIDFCDNNSNSNTIDSIIGSPESIFDTNSNSNSLPSTNIKSQASRKLNTTLTNQVEKEFERIETIAKSGFLSSNSNTITLLHLSLLLGRASVICLEYEWVSKKGFGPNHPDLPLPGFCSSTNPMANSLRRLCHIAALELASFRNLYRHHFCCKKETTTNATERCDNSNTNHGVPKKGILRNIGTMTDHRLTMPKGNQITETTIPILPKHHHLTNNTHSSQNPSVQVNGAGSGEVFRVPLVPAPYRTVMSKEEEEKLKLQQQRAKAIMQEGNQRSGLLKRRNVRSRSKPIIVQRTLLPKVPNEQIIKYIQPPSSPSPVIVSKGFLDTVSSMPTMAQNNRTTTTLNLVACTTTVTTTASGGGSRLSIVPLSSGQPSGSFVESQGQVYGSLGGPGVVALERQPQSPVSSSGQQFVTLSTASMTSTTNILELAVQSANITASPVKEMDSSFSLSLMSSASSDVASHMHSQAIPLTTPPSRSPSFASRDYAPLSVADQSNISLSDLDISLASTNMSSMGPDAGDKFLDSVLERSQQGFSGLITPVAKSSGRPTSPHQHHLQPPVLSLDSSLSAFDISGMKTPPRSSSPTSSSSSSQVISSSSSTSGKVLHPDQSWMAGESADVSLSSILGQFSSFQGGQSSHEPKLKTPIKASSSSIMSHPASLFDQSSSNGVDNPVSVAIPKPDFVSDISLNSLLGDPSLSSPVIKTDKHLAHNQTDNNASHGSLTAPSSSLFSEVSQDSLAKLDVDVTLQGMVNDSSLDLVSKFEKLAAQMAENRQEQEVSNKVNTPVNKMFSGDNENKSID